VPIDFDEAEQRVAAGTAKLYKRGGNLAVYMTAEIKATDQEIEDLPAPEPEPEPQTYATRDMVAQPRQRPARRRAKNA
jgi:hypothetical protein